MSRALIRLAVIGAGPKAAALAAKVRVLNDLRRSRGMHRRPRFELVIFEEQSVANHWAGEDGYTDGAAPLCTPAERDLGFPYQSSIPGVNEALFAQFSWQAYLVRHHSFSKWVDLGRMKPKHAAFAQYVRWAIKESGCKVVPGTVTQLLVDKDQWVIRGVPGYRAARPATASVGLLERGAFDGVVVTGPGPARQLPLARGRRRPTNLFDGSSFWLKTDRVSKALAEADEPEIAILGGGGTAAAIISWLVKHEFRHVPIRLVAPQPTLFSRSDNSFENLLFSREEYWESLTSRVREETFIRLNRGVVWDAVINDIKEADIEPLSGRGVRINRLPNGEGSIDVELTNGFAFTIAPTVLIDATGFNDWWFTKLLSEVMTRTESGWGAMRETVGPGLAFSGPRWPHPPLHVPMHASRIGPGFASLMVLGAMSDRILNGYLD